MTVPEARAVAERRACVLICDADEVGRRVLRTAFARRDALHVIEAATLDAALPLLPRCAGILVAAGADGEAVVTRVRATGFDGTLVVALADGSVADAVAAMRAGADDVVPRPLRPEDVVDRLLAGTPARRPDRRRSPRPPVRGGGDFCGLIGRSPAMSALYDAITRMAASRAPVFITGEGGTGKDMVAAALHACAPWRDMPVAVLNCRSGRRAGLETELFGGEGPGLLEMIRGGTLHLDEVCELEGDLQEKLLAFLETGRLSRSGQRGETEAEVRLVCSTARDPLEEVRAGRLREDLFYRLDVLPLAVPPLRARGEDVVLLAESFLARCAGEEGRPLPRIGPEAAKALRQRAFPGNVRELKNLMRRIAVLLDGREVPAQLVAGPPETPAPGPAPAWSGMAPPDWPMPGRVEPLSVVERRAIEAAISAFDGNIALAAAALDLSPSTLYRKKLAWQDAGSENRRLS